MKTKKLLGVNLDILLTNKDKNKDTNHREEEKLEDSENELKNSIPVSRKEDNKEKKQQVPPVPSNNQVNLDSLNKECFQFSKIGYTLYPVRGIILNQILEEMKIREVVVKEVNCWQFLFTFPSQEKCDVFDWKLLKDWVSKIRNPCKEDLMIKRQAIIEVRGFTS